MRLTLTALAALAFTCSAAQAADQPVIGLITKTETNPFFVKMKEGTAAAAKAMVPSCNQPRARRTATTPARSPPSRT